MSTRAYPLEDFGCDPPRQGQELTFRGRRVRCVSIVPGPNGLFFFLLRDVSADDPAPSTPSHAGPTTPSTKNHAEQILLPLEAL